MAGLEHAIEDSGFTLSGEVVEYMINTGFEQPGEADEQDDGVVEVLVGDMLMVVEPMEAIHRWNHDASEEITARRIRALGGPSREW